MPVEHSPNDWAGQCVDRHGDREGTGTCAWVCKPTLSVPEAAVIADAIPARFPIVVEPCKDDICYATTNR